MLLPVLLLLLVCRTETGYTGAVFSYTSKDFQGGSFSVVERFKFSYSSCEQLESWQTMFERSRDEWCLGENTLVSNVHSTWNWRRWDTGTWIYNRNYVSSGGAGMFSDVRNRSDINRPNSSPQTSILPVVRVPSNCQRNISLLTFDPDGDEVECRYAADVPNLRECYICTPPSVLRLSSPCTLLFRPTNRSAEGLYAVQLTMEDFPRENIILIADSTSFRNASNAMSKIPVQFVFKVDPAAPSCTEGEYLPRFLPPTPEHRDQIFINVYQMLEITIRADATQSMITELLFNGPVNMVKNSSGSGYFTLRWTPSASEAEESHPICFVVQANDSSSVYQSELRCVIATVGNSPTATSTIPATTQTPNTTTTTAPIILTKAMTPLTTTITPITAKRIEVKSSNLTTTLITPTPMTTTRPPNTTTTATPIPTTTAPSPTKATKTLLSTTSNQSLTVATNLKHASGPYYVVALNGKISTSLSLESDYETIVNQIKDKLIICGLPPTMIVHVRKKV